MVTDTRSHPKLKQNLWKLDAILPLGYTLPLSYVQAAPAGVWSDFCLLLSRDVYSEGDAQILYDYLCDRNSEFSPAFLQLLALWRQDEAKHYQALRRTYHCLAGVSFEAMDQHFAKCDRNLEPIRMALTDEFTLLVTLMFDEIGSVYSYRRDLWEYYRHFGNAIYRIGQHLVQDEGQHFGNAAEVLLAHHQHRLGEVHDFLIALDRLEKRLGCYYQTFFLDHAQEQHRFPQNFNAVIIQVILARLGLAARPSSQHVKALWQWVPNGFSRVPIQ